MNKVPQCLKSYYMILFVQITKQSHNEKFTTNIPIEH